MGATNCYAMVRGSAVRVTGLGARGSIPEPIPFAVSRSAAKVTITEVTEPGNSETLNSDQADDETRLRFSRSDQTVNYLVDIDFVRVDPGVLSLITGVALNYKVEGTAYGADAFGVSPFGGVPFGSDSAGTGFDQYGFGQGPFGGASGNAGFGAEAFGSDPFGQGSSGGGSVVTPDQTTVTGFDSATRVPPVPFALEIWSKLAGAACVGGIQQYGYTLFPFLKGGRLSDFSFANGLVSFNIRNAQVRRGALWSRGPYDLEGPHERLVNPVSGNTFFRQMLTTASPPVQIDGIQQTTDVIDGGTASVTSTDVLDGGTADAWVVEGGKAV